MLNLPTCIAKQYETPTKVVLARCTRCFLWGTTNLNPGSSADALVQNNSYPCFAPHWKMTAAKMAELEASKGRAGQPEEVTDVETLRRCKHFPVFFQKALLSLKCWLHHWIRKQAPCFYQPGSSSGYYKTWLPTEILPRGELRWEALIS